MVLFIRFFFFKLRLSFFSFLFIVIQIRACKSQRQKKKMVELSCVFLCLFSYIWSNTKYVLNNTIFIKLYPLNLYIQRNGISLTVLWFTIMLNQNRVVFHNIYVDFSFLWCHQKMLQEASLCVSSTLWGASVKKKISKWKPRFG